MMFFIGLIVGIVIMDFSNKKYKEILVSKANTNQAEYINGKFYYIVEEGFNK